MPAMVTVAQAALESNWGQSKLSKEANNYFGIKAHGNHARVQMPTEECENGATVAVEAEFAKYPSMLDCFQCSDRDSPAWRGLRGARERSVAMKPGSSRRSQSTGPPIRSTRRNYWRS